VAQLHCSSAGCDVRFVYIWISIFEIPIIYVFPFLFKGTRTGRTLKERREFSDRASEWTCASEGRTNFRNVDEIAMLSVHRSARIDHYCSAGTKWKVLKPYSDQTKFLRLQLFSWSRFGPRPRRVLATLAKL
jgi:hypothetical protein